MKAPLEVRAELDRDGRRDEVSQLDALRLRMKAVDLE